MDTFRNWLFLLADAVHARGGWLAVCLYLLLATCLLPVITGFLLVALIALTYLALGLALPEAVREEAAFRAAAQGALKGVLGYTEEKVVSTDFRDETCTSVFDAEAGIALDSTFVKVVSWYDNEWGYSSKVCEMVRVIAK